MVLLGLLDTLSTSLSGSVFTLCVKAIPAPRQSRAFSCAVRTTLSVDAYLGANLRQGGRFLLRWEERLQQIKTKPVPAEPCQPHTTRSWNLGRRATVESSELARTRQGLQSLAVVAEKCQNQAAAIDQRLRVLPTTLWPCSSKLPKGALEDVSGDGIRGQEPCDAPLRGISRSRCDRKTMQ